MKLSVIIPVYNAAPYLRDCLASVCLPGVEVIAVDDGSTDRSGAILDGWLGLVVVHQPNAGAAAARNVGMKSAHGDWLMFVDADDVLAEGWKMVLSDMILRCPEADLVGFSRTERTPLPSVRPGPVRRIDVSRSIGREQFDDGFFQYAYRRTIVEGIRFPPFVLGEDKLFQAEAFARARVCVRSDAIIYGYRQHGGSAVHQPLDVRRFDCEASWRSLWLKTLLDAGKRMDRKGMRLVGLVALEYHPSQLRQVTDSALRRELTERWFASLRTLARFPFAPYQRFVLRLLSVSRSRLLAALFCQVPFVLKQWLRHPREKRT